MYLMSAPATNAFSPAPVSTTARTSSSARELAQAVAQLGQRLDVERVERVLAVDRDDGDRAVAGDVDAHAGTAPLRKSTISVVVRARPEHRGDALLASAPRRRPGGRAADDDEHVLGAVVAQQVEDARDERHVRAGEDRDADGVGVLLDRGLDDLLGRLVQARVDDLHAGVAQRARDDLRAAVVPVEARLRDDDADLPATRSLLPFGGRLGHGLTSHPVLRGGADALSSARQDRRGACANGRLEPGQ